MSRISFGVWAAMALILVPLAGAQSYTVTDLGILGSGYYSRAMGLNDYGTVVGLSSVPNADYHAFVWTSSEGMRDLGVYAGDTNSEANGINNDGDIVGTSLGFFYPVPLHAVLWRHGGPIQEIGSLGGSDSFANAINNSGMIVGYSSLASGIDDAFLWTSGGGMQDLGTLPQGNGSSAKAINDSGVIVGYSGAAPPALQHAFQWTKANGMRDLGTLRGGVVSEANGINSSGIIVGYSNTEADHEVPFIWTASQGMRLFNVALAGAYLSGINASNQIVGSNGSVAFLWTPSGHMQTLDSLVPPDSGWAFSEAVAINRAGQIAATGTINGATHAALLTPVN
jgi:probable HAF family extracellular repeat protein